MNAERFEGVLDSQIARVRDVLVVKAAEYAPVDRLSNFRKAAHLQGIDIPRAIGGIMVKHTVSIFDMLASGNSFTLEQWDEKITDHINYLILLRAAIVENHQPGKTRAEEDDNLREPVYAEACD
jgi:hypothetical protein